MSRDSNSSTEGEVSNQQPTTGCHDASPQRRRGDRGKESKALHAFKKLSSDGGMCYGIPTAK